MDKTKTSAKQKKSSKNIKGVNLRSDMGLVEYSPTKELLDEKLIALAVWECLKDGDTDALIEIIQSHLYVVNKARESKGAALPRSTLYSTFKGKNPTIRTLSKMLQCLNKK